MNYVKKYFKFGDRVKFVKLGGDLMENKEGTICGVSSINAIDHYLIQLDEHIDYPEYEKTNPFYSEIGKISVIQMTEVCLELT